MSVISTTEERTYTTPAAVMYGLAAPSQGSPDLSTWRVRIEAGKASPLHVVDRDQVWMPVQGALEFLVDGRSHVLEKDQAMVVPAGAERRFEAGAQAAEAIVCMRPGGVASVPGGPADLPLPWAE